MKIIMECISSILLSILLNGTPFRLVTAMRGLRQGDPLSPYLFILGAEVLSRILLKEEKRRTVHGAKVSRIAPNISHLFFTDDSLLFCKAKIHEVGVLKDTLNGYCCLSGQLITLRNLQPTLAKGLAIVEREN